MISLAESGWLVGVEALSLFFTRRVVVPNARCNIGLVGRLIDCLAFARQKAHICGFGKVVTDAALMELNTLGTWDRISQETEIINRRWLV